MVHRIAGLDVPSRFAGVAPSWLLKLSCAVLGVGAAVILRLVADMFAPGVSPYAFIYPASLIATLLGGWQAGVGTLLISGFLAWEFVVSPAPPGEDEIRYQAASAIITAFTTGLMIAVGEGFRVAARRVVDERNAKLAQRELLFRELQHRVGNDFAIVSSLLDLQRRRSADPETRSALEAAMGRIRSISRVHRQIYALPESTEVDVRLYLHDLCAGLTDATLPPAGVTLNCHCDAAFMPRERALALGLAANELITNAIKHAFPDGRDGAITVRFAKTPSGWQLAVQDNGVGFAPDAAKAGLGTGLVNQFVAQAGGRLTLERNDGTEARIDLPPDAAHAAPGGA